VRGCVYRDIAGSPAYTDLIGLWGGGNVQPVLGRFIQQFRRMQRAAAGNS
jgi:hypothetical protein